LISASRMGGTRHCAQLLVEMGCLELSARAGLEPQSS
jgi:hypothetical protein